MNYRIKTCYGEFIVTPTYNTDVFTSAFDVYKAPLYEEEVFGDYVGEFFSKLDIVDNKKHFIEELEEWVKDKDLYDNEKEKCTKQREIIYALENLVHKRFSVESLE